MIKAFAPTTVLALALLAVSSPNAFGQTCRGGAPLKQQRSYQAGAAFARGDTLAGSFTEAAGTFLTGDSMAFGVIQVGRGRYGSLDRSSKFLGITAGLEGPTDPRSRLVLCPSIGVLQEWGPTNIDDSGIDLNILQVAGGVTVGAIAVRSGNVMLIPSVGLLIAGARYDFTQTGQTESGNDRFAIATAAVGLIFNRVAVTPSVAFPFHAKVAKTTARVDVVVSFGG